jgi:predicted TIM-barrel fold metal-dependent hydrolase
MADKTFYDIHMHAMNLSHPYLLAFIQRLKIHQILILNSIFGPIASLLIGKNFSKIKNLLAVMENDLGSFFLMVEDYLKKNTGSPLLNDGKFNIGGNVYSRIILTPLMMDFGYKNIKDNPDTYYNELSQKPIVEQVIDVFNGIKKYHERSPDHIFEIYPFLGLNTKNYDIGRIEKMMDKYFSGYNGFRESLYANIGRFDGDIEHLGSNFFAGIKVYPPLGFDPWPGNTEELAKVRYVYDYCCRKGIPVTAHGSEGGFVVVPKKEAKNYTLISKWGTVLGEYPKLKLNLAHFPIGEKFLKIFPKEKRLKEILSLVIKHDNLYVDFSNRAVSDKYYVELRNLIDSLSGKPKTKLKQRILFGSDFTINLMAIDSYNKYLEIFSRNTDFDREEKDSFCSANPERFLFS